MGRAQQAYAEILVDHGHYEGLKTVILRHYDINEKTYRQRFQEATLKDNESYLELAISCNQLAIQVAESVHGKHGRYSGINRYQAATVQPAMRSPHMGSGEKNPKLWQKQENWPTTTYCEKRGNRIPKYQQKG